MRRDASARRPPRRCGPASRHPLLLSRRKWMCSHRRVLAAALWACQACGAWALTEVAPDGVSANGVTETAGSVDPKPWAPGGSNVEQLDATLSSSIPSLSGHWRPSDGGPERFVLRHFEDTQLPLVKPNRSYALGCLAACWWRGGYCHLEGGEDGSVIIECKINSGARWTGTVRSGGGVSIAWHSEARTAWQRDTATDFPATPQRLDVAGAVRAVHVVFAEADGGAFPPCAQGPAGWSRDGVHMFDFWPRVELLAEDSYSNITAERSQLLCLANPMSRKTSHSSYLAERVCI
eukprot:TRINITY_DN10385_c0_g1_i3.p1 TRINITY_DN10385_c0_g1~~TRINITY_DN10385_c0_g1_i3.p1  ORF type:complete len:292 (-),score=19.73 TRINITY_DN10385_c0_g1_i3:34-909(-)